MNKLRTNTYKKLEDFSESAQKLFKSVRRESSLLRGGQIKTPKLPRNTNFSLKTPIIITKKKEIDS